MATKRDLVEAYSFSKRRLVTAFLSGAPGGREVEPSRPGRTIIGGVALAVLLVAGAAVTGVFKPRTDAGWQDEGLVTSKERATDYVIIKPDEGEDPVLRPLINITSAMLLFGHDVEATRVPEKELKTLEVGEQIGILGAPGSPPDATDLIQEGWTACTAEGSGIRLTVSGDAVATPSPRTGFLVRHGGRIYLIAEGDPRDIDEPRAYRYEVPGRLGDEALQDLTDLSKTNALEVSGDWLRLFPSGGTLNAAQMKLGGRLGSRADFTGAPQGAEVGDYYVGGDRAYAIGAEGAVELTDFTAALIAHVGGDSLDEAPTAGRIIEASDAGYVEANWPARPTQGPDGELCAALTPHAERPLVQIVQFPEETARAQGLPPAEVAYDVDSGAGAYVRSGAWDPPAGPGAGADSETVPAATEEFLIDSRGRSYRLQGPETAELLGFGGVAAPVAPASWVKLFERGVTLSLDAARCPPERGTGKPCE